MFTRFSRRLGLLLFCIASQGASAMPDYFSYYALGHHTPAATDHVNLYWVYSWNWQRQDLIEQLDDARSRSMKALLHAETIFFEGPQHAPGLALFSLRSDAASRWAAFVEDLQQRGLLETVVAVYPCDEPDLQGVSDNTLQDVIRIIRAHPLSAHLKIATFFTVNIAKKKGGPYRVQGKEHEYGTSLRLLDWVGFDCYDCDNIFTEAAWRTFRLENGLPRRVDGPSLYDNFRAQLDLPRQRIMLIPQSFRSTAAKEDGSYDEPDDPQRFFDQAIHDPAVVALVPFTWFDFTGWTGTARLPATLEQYRLIGKHIAASAQTRRMATGIAVEYLNRQDFPAMPGGQFFYTDDTAEQGMLDAGLAGHFERTGKSFKTGGSQALCRFYGSVHPGPNSHFLSIDNDECQRLRNLQQTPVPNDRPQWNFEGDSFRETPPLTDGSTVKCPLGYLPVYRYYNQGAQRGIDANHRYGTDAAHLAAFASEHGWQAEGIAFCAAP